MAFTYDLGTAQEILHKPIEIQNVAKGVKLLVDGGIILESTANTVMNLIFHDITTVTVNSQLFIDAAKDVRDGLHAYSGYLYRTTDELTAEMSDNLEDSTYVGTIRTELNNIFDNMTAGYQKYADIATDITDLTTDFYSGISSTFRDGWMKYSDPAQFVTSDGTPYTKAHMDSIYNDLVSANSMHYSYKTKIADLMSTYPLISIEEDMSQPVAKKLVTNIFWIVASGNSTKPTIRIHPDGNLGQPNPDVSYSIYPETIVLDKATSYTVKFRDETSTGRTVQLVRPDSSVIASLSDGASQGLATPADLRSLVFPGVMNLQGDTEGITGLDIFIVG